MAQKNRYLFRGRISERKFRDLLRLFALDITADRAAELTGLHHNTTLALYRLLRLRMSGAQDDTAALTRVGWAVRRLMGGSGPEQDLSAFLDRRDSQKLADEAEIFADRAGDWLDLIAHAADHSRLHGLSPVELGGSRSPRRRLTSPALVIPPETSRSHDWFREGVSPAHGPTFFEDVKRRRSSTADQ